MSIEAQIAALIVALDRNTNAHLGATATPETPLATPGKPTTTTTKPTGNAAAAPAIDYDTLKKLFLSLIKKNRDKTLAVVAAEPFKLGPPDGLKVAKPEQYAALHAALTALATELEAGA